MAPHIRQLTAWDEFLIWWEARGELGLDVVTYYGVCSAVGAVTGWQMGLQIMRLAG